MYLAIAVCILLVGAQATVIRYDGYKVYRVVPENDQQHKVLESLEKSHSFDVWKSSRVLNQPWDIMVEPALAQNLESVFVVHKLKFQKVTDDVESLINRNAIAKTRSGRISFDNYNRLSTIHAYVKELAANNPKVATLINIGKSYEGRDILGLKISSGGSNKPAILIDAGIHAREWMAPAQATYILNQLLENSTNANMYQNVDWYIIPSLNPDGYEYSQTRDVMWRKTRSRGSYCYGADANRNFGFHWNENGASDFECDEIYAGSKAFSEVEAQALRDFVLKNKDNIKLYLTFHSYGAMLLYPWGYTEEYPENVDELDSLAHKVNDAISAVRGTEYVIGSSTNVLYPAAGGSDDWVKGVGGVPLAYTIELPGSSFQPPASQIKPTVRETFEGVKVFHAHVEKN